MTSVQPVSIVLSSVSSSTFSTSLAVPLSSSAGILPLTLDTAVPDLLTEEDQQLLDEFIVRELSFSESECKETKHIERERERVGKVK